MTARDGHGANGRLLLAALLPATPPGALIRLIVGLDAVDLSQGAIGDESLDGLEQRIPAKHETDDRLHAGPSHCVLHGIQFLERIGRGLLDHDVLAGRCGCGDVLAVHVLRRAHAHDVHAVDFQSGIETIAADGASESVSIGQSLCARKVAARNRHHVGMRVVQEGLNVLSRHPAGSVHQHSVSSLCHIFVLPVTEGPMRMSGPY